MFAKLSALALCLTFVSALEIWVQDSAMDNTTVPLNFTISAGDPSNVDLILAGSNSSDTYHVANNITVAPTVDVLLPPVDHPGSPYEFIATQVGDASVEYARSDEIIIEN